jgi:hypothetical protein
MRFMRRYRMIGRIQLGSRVYLRNAVAGEPGCVIGFTRGGKARVDWVDLDLGRPTEHAVDTLVVDEAFKVTQLGLEFEQAAA